MQATWVILGMFRPETPYFETRFGILKKTQAGQIIGIGSIWTHFVAIFRVGAGQSLSLRFRVVRCSRHPAVMFFFKFGMDRPAPTDHFNSLSANGRPSMGRPSNARGGMHFVPCRLAPGAVLCRPCRPSFHLSLSSPGEHGQRLSRGDDTCGRWAFPTTPGSVLRRCAPPRTRHTRSAS